MTLEERLYLHGQKPRVMRAVSGDELLTYRVHHPPPAAFAAVGSRVHARQRIQISRTYVRISWSARATQHVTVSARRLYSLVPRPHPAHARRRGLVSQVGMLGLAPEAWSGQ